MHEIVLTYYMNGPLGRHFGTLTKCPNAFLVNNNSYRPMFYIPGKNMYKMPGMIQLLRY